MNEALLQQARRALQAAQRIVVLTGAGVSKESGVPTFRDAMDGLWARYDPTQLATPQAFDANPRLVWEWYSYRRDLVRQARPNPAHQALAQLERLHPQTTIITQNVDDLHEQAGSSNAIHLHGHLFQSKCVADCRGLPTLVNEADRVIRDAPPPACPACGALLRPNVVWFGEALPAAEMRQAWALTEFCDVCLVIGTSGMVQPAAMLPAVAQRSGAFLIEVNPYRSEITPQCDVWLQAAAGDALPRLIEGLT